MYIFFRSKKRQETKMYNIQSNHTGCHLKAHFSVLSRNKNIARGKQNEGAKNENSEGSCVLGIENLHFLISKLPNTANFQK